jgi:hypothetical protein
MAQTKAVASYPDSNPKKRTCDQVRNLHRRTEVPRDLVRLLRQCVYRRIVDCLCEQRSRFRSNKAQSVNIKRFVIVIQARQTDLGATNGSDDVDHDTE